MLKEKAEKTVQELKVFLEKLEDAYSSHTGGESVFGLPLGSRLTWETPYLRSHLEHCSNCIQFKNSKIEFLLFPPSNLSHIGLWELHPSSCSIGSLGSSLTHCFSLTLHT